MTADSCLGVRAVGARGTRVGVGSKLFLTALTVVVLMFCTTSNGASILSGVVTEVTICLVGLMQGMVGVFALGLGKQVSAGGTW